MTNFALDPNEPVKWRRDNEAEVIRRGGPAIVTQGSGTLFEAIGHAAVCPSENRELFKIWRADGEEISGGRLETLVRGINRRGASSVRA